MRPTSSGARPRELLGDDVVLDRPGAPAAELARPAHADPASARELGLPFATERDLFGEIVEAGREPLPYSHGKLARSHSRISSRSAASSGVGERSTCRRRSGGPDRFCRVSRALEGRRRGKCV